MIFDKGHVIFLIFLSSLFCPWGMSRYVKDTLSAYTVYISYIYMFYIIFIYTYINIYIFISYIDIDI